MSRKSKNSDENMEKLRQINELLRFVLTLDDEEILRSTIESVIESIQEIVDK